MDEPQTLDQVMDSAMNPDSTLETKVEQPAEPPASTEAAVTPQEEDSYTRIDPKTLPPELQAMHKSLLRDYTKKTQAIAQQRKEYEAWKAQQAQPQAPVQAKESPVPNQPDPSWTLEQFNAWNLAKVDERIAQKEQEALEAQQQKFLENAVVEFEATDERLNPESPAYDEYMRNVVGTKLDEALQEFAKENGSAIGFDYASHTKELIEQYEKYMESKAQSLAALKTKQAFNGVKRTAPLSVKGSSAPSKPAGGMSLDDAIDDAFSKT